MKTLSARGTRSIFFLSINEQDEISNRLRAGESKRSLASEFGLTMRVLDKALTRFNPEDRESRRLAIEAARAARAKRIRQIKGDAPSATNPWDDPLYVSIADLVSRGIEPSLRDDIIMEAYVNVLDDETLRSCLPEAVKIARTSMYALHGWKNLRSLDAPDAFGRMPIEQLAAPDEELEFADDPI